METRIFVTELDQVRLHPAPEPDMRFSPHLSPSLAPFFRFITLAAALALPAGWPAQAAPPRGQDLYEMRCLGCHAESVHARAKRTARSFEDVRAWVARWNATLRLRWTDDEVDDVAVHLNTRYYRYPCPPTVCRVVSQASSATPARR